MTRDTSLAGDSFTFSIETDSTLWTTDGPNNWYGGYACGGCANPIISASITVNGHAQTLTGFNSNESFDDLALCTGTQMCSTGGTNNFAFSIGSGQPENALLVMPQGNGSSPIASDFAPGTYTIVGGSGSFSIGPTGSVTSFNLTPTNLIIADVAPSAPSVININAAVSGYSNGVVTAPVELTLGAGCYNLADAYMSGEPGVLYDALAVSPMIGHGNTASLTSPLRRRFSTSRLRPTRCRPQPTRTRQARQAPGSRSDVACSV